MYDICIYVYTELYIYVYVYLYKQMIIVCIYVGIWTCIYICIYIYLFIYMGLGHSEPYKMNSDTGGEPTSEVGPGLELARALPEAWEVRVGAMCGVSKPIPKGVHFWVSSSKEPYYLGPINIKAPDSWKLPYIGQ